mgnify:CR=1 FL=1
MSGLNPLPQDVETYGLDPSDCPQCGRDVCEGCTPKPHREPILDAVAIADRKPFVESLSDMMARHDAEPEPQWTVGELFPPAGVVVWSGRPRSMKSLTMEDLLISLALGEEHAFGNPRFSIPEPSAAMLVSGEDSERTLRIRARLLLAGRELDRSTPIENFRPLVRRAFNLEVRENQVALVELIRETAKKTPAPLNNLVLDPVRAFFPGFDGGPRDGYPGRECLDRIRGETGISLIHLLHHETKPLAAGGKDSRTHAERASGGLVFSLADCPVSFGRCDDRSTTATPSMYKFDSDPKPFLIRFESSTPAGETFRDFVKVIAETVTQQDVNAGIDTKILAFLRQHPNAATKDIDIGVKDDVVSQRLRALKSQGSVTFVTGEAAKELGRRSVAKLWKVANP